MLAACLTSGWWLREIGGTTSPIANIEILASLSTGWDMTVSCRRDGGLDVEQLYQVTFP